MKVPKGWLLAIGGAEDKSKEDERKNPGHTFDFYKDGILKKLLDLAGQKQRPRIEIITTASSLPDEQAQTYKNSFHALGCSNVGHLKIRERTDAESPEVLRRLQQCTSVLFTGGDQLRLCSLLGGTAAVDLIRERYQKEHFVVAGTSAGAAAMSNAMIAGGEEEKAYLKGELKISVGFGFLPNTIVDTHFDARGRFKRLVQAIVSQPGVLGIGLDENTGVLVEKGSRLTVVGSGSVVIVDGSQIVYNDIAQVEPGTPISVSDIKVHVLTCEDQFDISSHKILNMRMKVGS